MLKSDSYYFIFNRKKARNFYAIKPVFTETLSDYRGATKKEMKKRDIYEKYAQAS